MVRKQYATARKMAAATPPSRNRYADFLRAVAILAVAFGHWLMAAVWVDEAGFHSANILGQIEATQWLTWAFQVMPIFFFVGGFSNAVGWQRHHGGYGPWLRARLQRLVLPTVPLVALWALLGLIGPLLGLDPRLALSGSQVALIPLWFLAVYVVMVAATPVTLAIWERHRYRALALSTGLALATDAFRAVTTIHVGFANYLFVWGAIYLLGHAWHAGETLTERRPLLLALGGAAALLTMTVAGPYHVSMVGVPGVEFGNTAPPSAALLALGYAQIGLALAVATPMRRWLQRPGAWTATILVNGSIMTLYVWHMTAMALTIGAVLWLHPALLAVAPGHGGWWITRPIWIGGLALATLPFLAIFSRFENRPRPSSIAVRPGAALAAAVGSCVAFTAVAAKGLTVAYPVWATAAVLSLFAVGRWLLGSKPADAPATRSLS